MEKVLTILGARPQFVKSAIVSKSLASFGLQELLLHTGQHYDPMMSDVFFEELSMQKPMYNLDINGGGHGSMTGRMLERLEVIMLEEKVDMVLVYGDTNSTLAGVLASSKLHIPVAHVEAGLRSFNRKMPEEINRVVADHLSDLLFAPTITAVENLTSEGISKDKVHHVGDVMLDAAIFYGTIAAQRSSVLKKLGLVE